MISAVAESLTTVPAKLRYYQAESYFRESWREATAARGRRILPVLQRTALLTIRPEALWSRKAEDCLAFMTSNGFVPIHHERVRIDRRASRELWRYWSTIATVDRLRVSDLVLGRADALLVFFADTSSTSRVPASVRLQELKGSAYPADRAGYHLRTLVGAPNRVMVMVHAPDEPIDIVRELGILFDSEDLARIYAVMAGREQDGRMVDLTGPLDALHPPVTGTGLCLSESVELLHQQITKRRRVGSAASRSAAARAADAVRAAQAGTPLDWRWWSGQLRAAGLDWLSWRALLVASQYIRHDVPGAECLITESGRERWLAGEGRLCHR